MASKRKTSNVKRRKTLLVEKLSDISNDSIDENDNYNCQKSVKKLNPKNINNSSEDNMDDNKDINSPKISNYFPIKNIYDPELFIDKLVNLERFKCGLCECICEIPRYQYCGCNQVYCQRCLNLFYDNYHHHCPKCQKETKELIPADNYIECLMKLKMKCSNYKDNCTWIGQYKDYKEHHDKFCPKEIINCPNKGCVIKLLREEMNSHKQKCEYREFFCRECLSKMPYIDKKAHKNFCPKEIIYCPQGCGESIKRDFFPEHKKSCKNSDIPCPYRVFGCQDKYQRIKRDERLVKDNPKHMYLIAKTILDLQKKINKMDKTIENMKNEWKNFIMNNININNNKVNNANNNYYNLDNDNINNNIHVNNENESNAQENVIQNINNIQIDNSNTNPNSIEFLGKKRINVDEIRHDMAAPYNPDFTLLNLPEKDQNNKNNNEYKNETINAIDFFDYIYEIPKNFKENFIINNDIIEAQFLDQSEHCFVFFNKKYDIPKDSKDKFSFSVKLLTKSEWLNIGICDKKIVEINDFKLDPSRRNNKNRNSGIYSLNVNQLLWNCNNNKECMKLKYKSLSKVNTTFIITVDPAHSTVEFMINEEDFLILTNVKCFISENFSPFLTFLKDCRVQTIFNY